MVRCPTRFDLKELACGRTSGVQAERLLAHLDACEACGAWFDSATGDDRLATELREAAEVSLPLELDVVGASLGRYRALRRIGSGGMGIVYEAQQDRPSRRVALKVLQPLAATPSGLRRFELEGEVLSRLDHPAIAHVYEVGTFASPYGALPFLAMELVAGRPPLEHARELGLDTRARVQLFVGICAGVEHAHQRGVLHRDLKPSNVLVTPDGSPKLLDFGVARLLDRRADATATRTGQVVGTLAYMAPEQLASGGDAVDVRSDVYSLGVVLYELLSESRPHDVAELPLARAVQRLAEAEAPALDVRLRGADADLAAVVAKSLEKDPQRRYRSVGDFSDDLRRWLAGDAVDARRYSRLQRAVKTVRQHRRTAAILALGGVLVAVGTAGTLTQLLRARAAERQALVDAQAAVATGKFLEDLLAAGDPFESGANPDRSVRELLDEAARRLASGAALPPETRTNLMGTLGRAYMRLGEYERARGHLEERHLALVARGGEFSPAAVDAALDLVQLDSERRRGALALPALEKLEPWIPPNLEQRFADLRGRLYLRLRRLASARADIETALELARDSGNPDPMVPSVLRRLLAEIATAEGREDEGLALLLETLRDLEEALGPDHPSTAITRHRTGVLLVRGGRPDEAEVQFDRALRSFDEVFGPRNVYGPYVASDWADLKAARGEREAAIGLYRRALASLPERDPKMHVYRRARVCVRLAMLLEESGETEEMLAEATQLMGLDTSGDFDRDHPLVRLAKALAREGRYAEAAELYRDQLADLGPEEAETERTLTLYNNLAVALAHDGDLDEAEEILRGTLAVRRDLLGGDHVRTVTAEANLASVLTRAERTEEAEALLRHALEVFLEEIGADHARTSRTRRNLAEALLANGHVEEALAESEEALSVTLAAYAGEPAANVGDTWLIRGECLLAAGDAAGAREALLEARTILEAQRVLDERLLARTSDGLAECAVLLGR